MKQDEFNREILRVWQEAARISTKLILDRLPKFVVAPDRKKHLAGGLAVVSLNPSFPKEDRLCESFQDWMREHNLNYPNDFIWSGSQLQKALNFESVRQLITNVAEQHHVARYHYPTFFSRVNRIAKELGFEVEHYAHLDIYLWQTAESGEIKNIKKIKDIKADFICLEKKQENLFLKLLSEICPKIIVCVYARAADLLLELCDGDVGRKLGFKTVEKFKQVQFRSKQILLKRAVIQLPNKHKVLVFRPVKRTIPTGGFCMSDNNFNRVLEYFRCSKTCEQFYATENFAVKK